MSDDSKNQEQDDHGVSRRGFLQGGAALGAGILASRLEGVTPAAAQGEATDAMVGPGPVSIELHVNGRARKLTLEPRVTLLDALRNDLDLTGSKKVCDRASCGACTVLMDGRPVYACSVLAIEAQGASIETIENLGSPERLHPLQEAFVNHEASQCGYCTPGFVMVCKSMLDRNESPSSDEIRRGLSGNLCRCGTYVGMEPAIREAADKMKGGAR